MSSAKTERLVNLTMALLATTRFVTVEEIGRIVSGYDMDGDSGDAAFRRKFERDKEELRELGIPLETGPVDPLYGDEIGYRITRSDYALPPIALDPDEAAALGLAARLWSSAGMAQASADGLRKLAAAGVDTVPPPEGLDARVDATEPAFDAIYEAVRTRRPVRFDYRRPGMSSSTRHLQPWGVVSTRGHWYVAGYDTDRGAERVFRLSRITGPVVPDGPDGTVTRPPGVDVRAIVLNAYEPPRTSTARLRLAPGAGARLRRDGTRVDGTGADAAGDLLDVPFGDPESFADHLVGYGPDVVVLDPPELVSLVVARLRAVLAGTGATSASGEGEGPA